MFYDITGTSYTQDQYVNIAKIILQRTGKFRLTIWKWNCTKTVQRKWVSFKQCFGTAHQELQENSDLTVEDYVMHNTKMVRDVVVGFQEFLHQEQVLTKNTTVIEAPGDHMANVVQNTQKKLVN